MTKCSIIGGGGFIGSRLTHLLSERGRRLRVLDISPEPRHPLPAAAEYVQCDVGERDAVLDALDGIEEAVYLAYATVPKSSYVDPLRDIMANLPGTVRMLEAAHTLRLRKVVLVSSGGTVYGPARYLPVNEEHPTEPVSPYGVTKLAMEKYGLMFAHTVGLPVAIARPANAYGEGQRPFMGQGFIATAIGSILGGKEVIIYGDPGTIRDYIHVDDVAAGIAAVLENGRCGAAYNIGTGTGRDNRAVLAAIAKLADAEGLRINLRTEPPRQFDVPANILDSGKLRSETGWAPQVPFEEGLCRTWQWLKEHP
jgi:UDP-glucose 4-epimerase